jgi:uncharacterized protein (TIRG00374 family)
VRKFIFALVLLLAVLFIIARLAEMQNVLAVLAIGNFWFIALAILVEFFWLFNLGITYRSIYHILDMEVTPFYMARVAVASLFLSIIAPSGGLSSMALFIADARDKGRSYGRSVVSSVLFILLEYVATLIILIFGLGEMARRNNLHWSEITASLILLAGALVLAILLYLGMRSAVMLARVLAVSARAINHVLRPFIHRDYLSEARAYTFATEAAEGISALRHHPRQVIYPVLLAILNKSLLIVILSLVFLAFKADWSIATVIAGFSIAYLFLIVSPTPAGLGIVEGVMTVALRSLQVPLSDAAVITMAYRGITFWLPLLVGLVSFRTLRYRS